MKIAFIALFAQIAIASSPYGQAGYGAKQPAMSRSGNVQTDACAMSGGSADGSASMPYGKPEQRGQPLRSRGQPIVEMNQGKTTMIPTIGDQSGAAKSPWTEVEIIRSDQPTMGRGKVGKTPGHIGGLCPAGGAGEKDDDDGDDDDDDGDDEDDDDEKKESSPTGGHGGKTPTKYRKQVKGMKAFNNGKAQDDDVVIEVQEGDLDFDDERQRTFRRRFTSRFFPGRRRFTSRFFPGRRRFRSNRCWFDRFGFRRCAFF